MHLYPIISSLKSCELFGIFDEKFGKPLYPSSSFGVMGFMDVIPKIVLAKKALKGMVELSLQADKVLLIDSPAFNLPLAKAIKEVNPKIQIIYYILPKVWAWKRSRVAKVQKYCDELASIFPFEKQFYSCAEYVGNPLLDEIPKLKDKHEKKEYIAYLPGSRKGEISKLMPIFKEVAKRINKKSLLVIPPHFSSDEIQKIYGSVEGFEISRDTHESFNRSEFAFVCSGTATLEAALMGVPLVLAYKAKRFDAFIARIFVKLKHVGLANIIFDFEGYEALHVELLQEDVTVENLTKEYESMDRELFVKNSKKLHTLLKHGSKDKMIKLIQV